MKTRLSAFTWLFLIPLLSTCSLNIYKPLTGNSSDNDHLEEAESCLQKQDFDCARKNYAALSNQTLMNQKLCELSLSLAGMTISALIDTITNTGKGGNMLGSLANQIVPYSATKASAATDAHDTYCKSYSSDPAGDANLKALYGSLSSFIRCAVLMAKTDQTVATSDSDTSCTTPGDNDGTVTKSDITDNTTTGAISSKGMCPADVKTCQNDILGVDNSALTNAGLSNIATALSNLPAALKDSSKGTDAVRAAIASTLAN